MEINIIHDQNYIVYILNLSVLIKSIRNWLNDNVLKSASFIESILIHFRHGSTDTNIQNL